LLVHIEDEWTQVHAESQAFNLLSTLPSIKEILRDNLLGHHLPCPSELL